jgi:predicted ATPase
MDKHLDYMEVRWKNYKSFEDTKWIKIKPITIVLGRNNVGKSNFLSPFLLMNQTLNSRDSNTPIILKGSSYDGGNFQEIVHDYDKSKDVFFGLRYHIHESDKKLGELGSNPPGAFEITFGLSDINTNRMVLKSSVIYDRYLRRYFSLTRSKRLGYNFNGLGKKNLTKTESDSIKSSSPMNFLFSPNSVLYNYDKVAENEEKKQENIEGFSKAFSRILSSLSYNYTRAKMYVGDLSFIGPLREHPHRVYEITNETYYTVGAKGENMANLLNKIDDKKNELDEWIRKFGFGDSLLMENLYSNLYSIRFKNKNSNYYTSISNAGFGASQVLPLIVQALVSRENSLTIAEQPEIHLNPKLQSVLADLFVYMAKNSQKVIIETHSEHLILRLRTLIAKGEISNEDVALYFVDHNGINSTIREIKVETDGHISDEEWPNGFFEDSLNQSIDLINQQFSNFKE